MLNSTNQNYTPKPIATQHETPQINPIRLHIAPKQPLDSPKSSKKADNVAIRAIPQITPKQSFDQLANDIKARLNIVDFVGKTVTLKKSGQAFMGCCPFHKEKTPSFAVYPKTKTFVCFTCQAKGNVISFAMKHYGYEFKEALAYLAREAGLPCDLFDDSLSALPKSPILPITLESDPKYPLCHCGRENSTKAKICSFCQANQAWEVGTSNEAYSHKYAIKKGFKTETIDLLDARGGLLWGQSCLIIPMYAYDDLTTICGFQVIGTTPLGKGKDAPTKRTVGEYGLNWLGDIGAGLADITEGVATGASVYQDVGGLVIISFTAKNLGRACERFPDKKITILADNDIQAFKNEPSKDVNTGLQTAYDCKFGCANVVNVLYPEFPDMAGGGKQLSDFNDLAILNGAGSVKRAIDAGRVCSELSRVNSRFPQIDLHFTHSRYLETLPSGYDILFVQSPTGTGKTTVIADLIATVDSALYISHRRLLSHGVAKKLGLTSYLEKSHDSKKLALCIPSLPLDFMGDNAYLGYDLGVFDECSQHLSLITSKLSFAKLGVMAMMKGILETNKRVILMDASIDFETVNAFMGLMPSGVKVGFLVNTWQQLDGHEAVIHLGGNSRSRQAMVHDAVSLNLSAGLKPLVACDGAGQATVLGETVKELGRVKVVTAKTNDSNFIADINNQVTGLDGLFYSPVMGSGVDLSTRHFTNHYALFNEHLPINDLNQLINRDRTWQKMDIYMPETGRADVQSIAQIKQGYLDLARANTVNYLNSQWGLSVPIEMVDALFNAETVKNQHYLDIYARQKFKEMLQNQHRVANFKEILTGRGCTVTVTEMGKGDKDTLELLAETKETLTDNAINLVMGNDDKRADFATKMGLLPDELTDELVGAEMTKHLSSKVKLLALIFKTDKELGRGFEIDAGRVMTDKKNLFVWRNLIRLATGQTGIDPKGFNFDFDATWRAGDFAHDKITKFIKKHANELMTWGLIGRADIQDTTKFIHKILRRAGVEIGTATERVTDKNGKEIVQKTYFVKNKIYLQNWAKNAFFVTGE